MGFTVWGLGQSFGVQSGVQVGVVGFGVVGMTWCESLSRSSDPPLPSETSARISSRARTVDTDTGDYGSECRVEG